MSGEPLPPRQRAAVSALRAALWPFLRGGNVSLQVVAGNLRDRLSQRPLYVTPAMIGVYLELTGALQDLVDVEEIEVAALRTAWTNLLVHVPALKSPVD